MLLADDHCHRRHINAVLKRVLVADFQRADIHSDRVIVRDRLHQIICNAAGRRGKASDTVSLYRNCMPSATLAFTLSDRLTFARSLHCPFINLLLYCGAISMSPASDSPVPHRPLPHVYTHRNPHLNQGHNMICIQHCIS